MNIYGLLNQATSINATVLNNRLKVVRIHAPSKTTHGRSYPLPKCITDLPSLEGYLTDKYGPITVLHKANQ